MFFAIRINSAGRHISRNRVLALRWKLAFCFVVFEFIGV